MIPISLTLQGFYSYKHKQTIDFTRLTKAGVFGIFGATGSGKSAIIEAILFALYGETERLNSKEERSYNFMNLQSNELYIELICFSHFTQTQYTIQVNAKRSSKHFDQVSPLKRTCYKLIESTWTPISESLIETEVTGLSYNNFRQTVIIPQGKFMDFLQLSPTERTTMLKNLFGLHEFELYDKVKHIEFDTEQRKTFIEGNLQEIGEVNSDTLQVMEKQEKELLAQGITQKKILEDLQQKLQLQLHIKQDAELLEQTKKNLIALRFKEQEYKELEKTIQNIALCVQHIAPLYDSIKHKQVDTVALNKTMETTKQQAVQLEIELERITKTFSEIEHDYKNLSEYQNITNQIKLVVDLKNIELQMKSIENESTRCNKLISDLQTNLIDIEKKYDEHVLARKNLLKNTGDISTVFAQKQELEAYIRICKHIEDCREKRIANVNEIETLQTQFCTQMQTITHQEIEFKSSKTFIEDTIASIEHTIQQIDTQLQQAQFQHQIESLRNTLKLGEQCPVCGATTHFTPDMHNNIDKKYDQLQQEKQNATQNLLTYSKLLQLFEKTQNHIILIQKQDHEVSHTMHSLTIERNLNDPDFTNRDIHVFDTQIEQITNQQKQAKQLEELIVAFEENKKTQFAEMQHTQQKYSEIQTNYTEIKTRYTILHESIEASILDMHASFSVAETLEIHASRLTHIQKIQTSYETQKNEYENKNESYKSIKISILEKEKALQTLREDIASINQKLLFAIESYGFESIQHIETLIQQKDLLLTYSQKLEQYKHDLLQTQQVFDTLSKKLEGKRYNPQEIDDLQNIITQSETTIQQTRDVYVRINEQVKVLKSKIEKQADLLQQLTACNHDLENIHVLKSLFKQSGFVTYMSTKYIHMICEKANERFISLTKHALQLEVSNNSFVVRDFLNNGKIRHIKTLSGGQAFQAALSLALALSESVQLYSPKISNFFFIDEGFGSQDKESLTTVFETLRSLQNEGKIVGIISHVEEIKENVPVYINVENNNGTSLILGA